MVRLLSGTLCLLGCLLAVSPSSAQFSGSRGGVEQDADPFGRGRPASGLPMLSTEAAQGFITIDGVAETRVRPTEIRIVLAVTGEGETAQDCRKIVETTIERLRGSWNGRGIPRDKIFADFIAVLPKYEWTAGKRSERDVFLEKKIGYRMQTNLHVAVANDAEAQAAINAAFEHDVTDIIAFDYGSRDLDAIKVKVREQATKAALEKAKTLLGMVFQAQPSPINLQEKTTVTYPDALYHSFTNTQHEIITAKWSSSVPFIEADRPKNTYYRGLFVDGDIRPAELPMTPEISVVSTVRLYYDSPSTRGGRVELQVVPRAAAVNR